MLINAYLHCKVGWIYILKKAQPIVVSLMQLNCAVIEIVSSDYVVIRSYYFARFNLE